MILHAAEVWISLAACFAFGGLVGSIVQRAVALTALGRLQAKLIRFIDRVIRWLERRLLPWRGTVPDILPQTVPVPPPDFGHVLDEPGEVPGDDEVSPRHVLAAPLQLADLPASSAPVPPRAAPAASLKQAEAIARGDAAGFRPLALHAPRHGQADPLHLIQGVTKRHAGRLAQVGIFHFSQIASWTPQEAAWIAAYLGAGDGPVAKDWVGQAIHFAGADEPIEVVAKEAATKRTATKKSPAGDRPLKRKNAAERKSSPAKTRRRSKVAKPVAVADEPEDGGE